jgi:hypothetical protein
MRRALLPLIVIGLPALLLGATSCIVVRPGHHRVPIVLVPGPGHGHGHGRDKDDKDDKDDRHDKHDKHDKDD